MFRRGVYPAVIVIHIKIPIIYLYNMYVVLLGKHYNEFYFLWHHLFAKFYDYVSSLNWQMRNSNNKCMLEIDGVFLFDRKQLFQ